MKKEIIFLIFLTGCTVGPNYHKPNTCMPQSYAEKVAQKGQIDSLKEWWKTFDDPVLNDLVETAVACNYSLKAAIEKIEETRSFYRIKNADLFPEIDLNAAATRTGYSKDLLFTNLLPITVLSDFQIGFDAMWELDIFGKLRRNREAAFDLFQASQESMRDVYITLISDVARYYVDICTLQNIIDLTNKKIELQKQIYRLTNNLNSTGLESKISEQDQMAVLQRDEEALKFYDTYLKDSIYSLGVLLGQMPEQILEKIPQYRKIPETLDKISVGVPSTLLRRRPDIRQAERELAAATAKIGAAIADYFPSFSLTGNTSLESNFIDKWFTGNSLGWSIGGLLNWPIITFGRISANVDMMKAKERQAFYFYQNTVLSALKDVESALATYFNEEKKLMEIKIEAKAYDKMASLEKNKYQTGLVNLSRAYEFEKVSLESAIKEIESKRALAHNLIALYKAMGGGEW